MGESNPSPTNSDLKSDRVYGETSREPWTTRASMKLVIVSNRLPVSLVEKECRLEFAQSPGGLASGLRTYLHSPKIGGEGGFRPGWAGSAGPSRRISRPR